MMGSFFGVESTESFPGHLEPSILRDIGEPAVPAVRAALKDEDDLTRVIQEARQGRVEYRVDKTANIHVPVGKAGFSTADLLENMSAVMEAIVKARPAASKGTYIRKVTICNTMGPAIRVDVAAATMLSTA